MYEILDDVRGVSKGLNKWETFNQAVEGRAALKKGSVCMHPISPVAPLPFRLLFRPIHQFNSRTNNCQAPEDIAAAVSFLAGPQSNMMTGQSIIIDGGKFASSSGLCALLRAHRLTTSPGMCFS